MASLESLQIRQAAAKGVVQHAIVNDECVAIRLKALPAAGAVTSVTVTTATNIVMVTANGGTDTYTFAAYTTVGALVDAINKDGMFEAIVLDTLRSKATASQFVDGAITIGSLGYYDVLVDSSVALYHAIRLTFDRNTGVNSKLKDMHRVTLKEVVTSLTLGGGADANALAIYECAPAHKGSTETKLVSKTPTTGSVATWNWASGYGGITAADGNDLVVIVSDGTSFATTDYMTLAGIIE